MLYYITYYILYFLVISNSIKRDSTQTEKAIREEIYFRNLYLFRSIRLISSIFRSEKRNRALWTFDICRLEVPLYATIPGKMKFAIRRKLINTRVASDLSSFHL